MKNSTRNKVCSENYQMSDGIKASDEHYTWGALCTQVGIENILNLQVTGRLHHNGIQSATLTLKCIPL